MCMSLTYVDDILIYIRLNYEDRILMSAHIETLSLPDSIELSAVMSADNLSVWNLLIPCLLDMFPATAIGLSFKSDILFHRLG